MATQPFVAEIRMFAGNFAPIGWALCNGQILPISQNTALFSLLGTYYGGNGTTNFGLPNLQGCAPMAAGNGGGLTPRTIGETGGSVLETLLLAQMPAHTHTLNGGTAGITHGSGDVPTPVGNSPGIVAAATNLYAPTTNNKLMSPLAVQPAGGSLPHNNMQPYLAVTFIIALQGMFPQRG